MSSESAPKPHMQFDIRTVERNIKKGHVTRKDYEKYLKALPDVSANVAPPEEDTVEDDEDEDETDVVEET